MNSRVLKYKVSFLALKQKVTDTEYFDASTKDNSIIGAIFIVIMDKVIFYTA